MKFKKLLTKIQILSKLNVSSSSFMQKTVLNIKIITLSLCLFASFLAYFGFFHPTSVFSQTPYQMQIELPDSSYHVVCVNGNPAAPNATSYNFNLPPGQNIAWSISNLNTWFQVDSGDVRMKNIVNHVPAGLFAGTTANPSSLFFSSSAIAQFNPGASCQRGWVVSDEYGYTNRSENTLGSTSYSFYLSKASQNGVTPDQLCTSTLSNCNISNLTDGKVYQIPGDVIITGFSFQQYQHIVILVSGTTTIATEMKVPKACSGNRCSLFVLASQKDIIIDPAVGSDPTDTDTNLDGIYTSQGKIILAGAASCPSADKRLNIGGALIANSLYPFSSSGTGTLVNGRSLCAANAANPTFKIYSRPDFIVQLTDFYKTATVTWREVQP